MGSAFLTDHSVRFLILVSQTFRFVSVGQMNLGPVGGTDTLRIFYNLKNTVIKMMLRIYRGSYPRFEIPVRSK
jgi:hypothetical protein